MSKAIYVLGLTCSGKDYLIERACSFYPKIFAGVQVGKEFRLRYPPEHFKGQGAPDHTEAEAMEIFKELVDKAERKNTRYILVSGQPRRPSQVEPIINYLSGSVLWMYASDQLLRERMMRRFHNDKEGLKLAEQRITNDKIMYYETLFRIVDAGIQINTFDVNNSSVDDYINDLAEAKHATPK